MSNIVTFAPTQSPIENINPDTYSIKDLFMDFSLYIFFLFILILYCIKTLIIHIRITREQSRRRRIFGITYDIELGQYDYTQCFNEKKYPDLTNEQNNCIICYEDYKINEKVYEIKKCNHNFHKNCINQWLNEKEVCPICRINITII